MSNVKGSIAEVEYHWGYDWINIALSSENAHSLVGELFIVGQKRIVILLDYGTFVL